MFDWQFKNHQVVRFEDDDFARLALFRYENEDGDVVTVVFEGFMGGWHFKGLLESLSVAEAEQVLVDAFKRLKNAMEHRQSNAESR